MSPKVFLNVCAPKERGTKGRWGRVAQGKQSKRQWRVKEVAPHRRGQRCMTVYCPKFQTISLIYSPDLLFLSSDNKSINWLHSSSPFQTLISLYWTVESKRIRKSRQKETDTLWTIILSNHFWERVWVWAVGLVDSCTPFAGSQSDGGYKSEIWSLNPYTHILNLITSF